jgi:imidazolonepropionase-like amidohydrolase
VSIVELVECKLILDGAGGRREGNLVIEVADGRIASITETRRSTGSVTHSADVVMPGMIDLHVHLAAAEWPADPHPLVARLSASEGYMALSAASNARDMLRSGFTTVRDLGAWGVDANMPVMAVRDAIDRELAEGPRIHSAGWVGQTGGHNDLGLPIGLGTEAGAKTADGPWQVRALVRQMIRAGSNLIKTATGGGMGSLHEQSWWPNYTPEELDALVGEAHAYGVRVAVHAYHPDQIHKALDAGADTIEHGIFADQDCLTRMAELGVTWVPTLSVYSQETIAAKVEQGADDHVIAKFMHAKESAGANIKLANELGVRIGCGTDVYNAGRQFFLQSGIELVHLVRNGITPDEAIRSATSIAAAAMDMGTEVGRVEAGMRADLVGLSADPTADITAVGPGGALLWVIKDGNLVSDVGIDRVSR